MNQVPTNPIIRALYALHRAAAAEAGRISIGHDTLAGLTLAAVAVPEQMATARLGHFSPEVGFLAFIAGTLGFAFAGANRYLSAGADSTITPIFAGSMAALAAAGSGAYAGLAALLAVMVGIIVTTAGICRLGWISNLLSAPVTSGFLAGISAHIIASQLPVLCEIPPDGESPIARLAGIAAHAGDANVYAVALGLGVLAATAGFERWKPRWPGALIGVAAAGFLTWFLALETRGVTVLGTIAAPTLNLPHALPGSDDIVRLASLALLIAIVVIIQTAATTRAFPPEAGAMPDIDRDLIGVGAGSILAALVGAFPVNASPPRTAVTADAGARSKAAGLVAALAVGLLAFFGAGLLRHIPGAALAGVLLFVALRILHVRTAMTLWRQSKGEFLLVIATAAAIVVLPIETGVAIGVLLSLIHGMWTTTRTQVIVLGRVPGTSIWWPGEKETDDAHDGVLVLAFQAPLSFLNAENFRHGMLQAIFEAPKPLRLVVLEAGSVVEIDFTAAHVLEDVIRRCQAQGTLFAISRLQSLRAQESLRAFGILDLLGENRIYRSVYEAVAALAPDAVAAR